MELRKESYFSATVKVEGVLTAPSVQVRSLQEAAAWVHSTSKEA